MSTSLPPLSSNDYTVACICPMGVELAPVEAILDEIYPNLPTSRDQNAYTLGRIGAHNIVVAAMPQTGNNSAATVATQLLNDFPSVRFGLLVGIGGGVPGQEGEDDVRLGDIVVSQPTGTFGGVVQYDMGKVTAEGFFERTGVLGKPPAVLRANIEKLKARYWREGSRVPQYLSEMMRRFPGMAEAYGCPGAAHDQLFKATYSHLRGSTCCECDTAQLVQRQERRDEHPRVHYGTIGSANAVIKDGATRERLKQDLKIICVEMEGVGLMDSFPCLVVRGICDYADTHKNKRWQPYAAAVAAAYMKELLLVVQPHEVAKASHAAEVTQRQSE
jgi:nucleoside phosphorylase